MASFGNGFFDPPIGLASFVPGLPPPWVFYTLNFVAVTCAIFLLFGRFTRGAALGLAGCLWVGNSFGYSFGKIDHDILIVVAPLVMAFSRWGDAYSLDARDRNARDRGASSLRRGGAGWPPAMLALLIGCGMMYAALQKLSGGWLDLGRYAALHYLMENYYQVGRHNPLAAAALRHTPMALWKLPDLLTVLLEASFLLAAFVDWTFLERWPQRRPSFRRLIRAFTPVASKMLSKLRAWHLLVASTAVFGLYMAGVSPQALSGRIADEPEFVLGLVACPLALIVAAAYLLTFFERGSTIRNATGASPATAELLRHGSVPPRPRLCARRPQPQPLVRERTNLPPAGAG